MTGDLVEELVDWGKSHGAFLNPDVEIYYDETTGLSFRASQELARESSVATCPYGISLSYLNAIDEYSPIFSPHGDSFPRAFLDTLKVNEPHIISHFFLMQQYILKEKSFWWLYIRLLPQPDQADKLCIPIWWAEEDLQFLESTNAEPAIKIRKSLWKRQFEQGIKALLKDPTADGSDFWNVYGVHFTEKLYQWAATIFGTRSFRASLSLPQAFHQLNHVKKDNFSLLLPILDIGNHNGINNVEWIPDPQGGMILKNIAPFAKGAQIFNFYGNKSNSELLVGYGFILPKNPKSQYNNDTFNLALKPTAERLTLRKTQHCYVAPATADEERMFSIRAGSGNFPGEECFGSFSQGFVDITICMIANQRETDYLLNHPEYCPESDPGIFWGPLYRAAIVFLDIRYKLKDDIDKLRDPSILSRIPANANQRLALHYRERQIDVIEKAMDGVHSRVRSVHNSSIGSFSTMEDKGRADSVATGGTYTMGAFGRRFKNGGGPYMLPLEAAFQWLELEYPSVHEILVSLIAEDQDEPLPLDWNILIGEGWNFTYLAVWLAVVWVIWLADPKQFGSRHNYLCGWLLDMSTFYMPIVEDASFIPSTAEKQDENTINSVFYKLLCSGCTELPSSGPVVHTFLNLATLVAHEESFDISPADGVNVMERQRVLCIFRPGEEKEAGTSQVIKPISP